MSELSIRNEYVPENDEDFEDEVESKFVEDDGSAKDAVKERLIMVSDVDKGDVDELLSEEEDDVVDASLEISDKESNEHGGECDDFDDLDTSLESSDEDKQSDRRMKKGNNKLRQDSKDFLEAYFKVEKHIKASEGVILPSVSEKHGPQKELPLESPEINIGLGRRRENRKRGPHEDLQKYQEG
ncbi:hypothetical protein Cgig2_027434 [Carnegiea gigantea]|uniref:Uncharacterized protein n=1 Tax=Carnegiea gigantea TaxID=171969 RepID=A0A9Q1Q8G2_9CARY|nr:hypothetical protein Cgig2_027434 [Carnegiea gigantea]